MLMLLTTALLGLTPPQGEVKYPPRPGPREFVLDEAKLLSPQIASEIRTLCDQTLTAKKVPIVVVTIPSLAAYGAGSWPIERYAMNLMGEWGIGWEDWNLGMLLLVAPGDRKARIELGGSWARRKDDAAQRVMGERIIPRFKQGDFAGGILEGVKGLQAIALDVAPAAAPSQPQPRSAPQPSPQIGTPSWLPGGACAVLALPLLIIAGLAVLSRLGRGSVNSWGAGGPWPGSYGGGFGSGIGGGLIGGALGSMLYNSLSRHSSGGGFFGGGGSSGGSFGGSSGGGSFGGGSFGGGFSGGGGATGSW